MEALTPATLKKMLAAFEKKVNKNTGMRVKYADQPERFGECSWRLKFNLLLE